ncbi:MAG: CtsR family transcriptional regulator [Eubacteriales bacterium]|nr:CtsR family transcriptional regulator [Eubacteriales bacterium]
MRLSDSIEDFIKQLILQADANIQLQRNELAEYFGCSPSQINYVLATRFTPDHGYVIKSKRGGGGHIEILRIETENEYIQYLIHQRIGDAITELEARNIVMHLLQCASITKNEAHIILASISKQALSLPIGEDMKNQLRARILKNILLEISINQSEKEE